MSKEFAPMSPAVAKKVFNQWLKFNSFKTISNNFLEMQERKKTQKRELDNFTFPGYVGDNGIDEHAVTYREIQNYFEGKSTKAWKTFWFMKYDSDGSMNWAEYGPDHYGDGRPNKQRYIDKFNSLKSIDAKIKMTLGYMSMLNQVLYMTDPEEIIGGPQGLRKMVMGIIKETEGTKTIKEMLSKGNTAEKILDEFSSYDLGRMAYILDLDAYKKYVR